MTKIMIIPTINSKLKKIVRIFWSRRRRRILSRYFTRPEDPHSFTIQCELDLLSSYASKIQSGNAIVEIGSYLGASTRYLLMGSAHASVQVFCIDTWNNETMPDGKRDTMSEFLANISPHENRINIIRCNSRMLGTISTGMPIGLAFLDGDHSYDCVKSDFHLIDESLIKNGYIAFHDVTYFTGVAKLVGEIISEGRYKLADFRRNLVILVKD